MRGNAPSTRTNYQGNPLNRVATPCAFFWCNWTLYATKYPKQVELDHYPETWLPSPSGRNRTTSPERNVRSWSGHLVKVSTTPLVRSV
jgi:hypothetical protein